MKILLIATVIAAISLPVAPVLAHSSRSEVNDRQDVRSVDRQERRQDRRADRRADRRDRAETRDWR